MIFDTFVCLLMVTELWTVIISVCLLFDFSLLRACSTYMSIIFIFINIFYHGYGRLEMKWSAFLNSEINSLFPLIKASNVLLIHQSIFSFGTRDIECFLWSCHYFFLVKILSRDHGLRHSWVYPVTISID